MVAARLKCRISLLALAKMSRHAANSTNEVMGMLIGSATSRGFDVQDSFELPVEATETRVNAMGESYEYIVRYLESLKHSAVNKTTKVVGWYHSHPGYGCFMSRIDIETQALNQRHQEPFVALVIDPVKTLEKKKVEIAAYRTRGKSYYELDVFFHAMENDKAALAPWDKVKWARALSKPPEKNVLPKREPSEKKRPAKRPAKRKLKRR